MKTIQFQSEKIINEQRDCMERYIRVGIRYQIGFKMITGIIEKYRREMAETVRKCKLQTEAYERIKE